MNVQPLKVSRNDAWKAFREYQSAVKGDRSEVRKVWKNEDRSLMRAYRNIANGKQVIDLRDAFANAGTKFYDTCPIELPQLAIAPSDAESCALELFRNGGAKFVDGNVSWRSKRRAVVMPEGTFPKQDHANWHLYRDQKTVVPMVPPRLRPKHDMGNYWTLWEVESWTPNPSRDPMLLKHIGGALYVVLATWDLTDVERAVLRR